MKFKDCWKTVDEISKRGNSEDDRQMKNSKTIKRL